VTGALELFHVDTFTRAPFRDVDWMQSVAAELRLPGRR
jgi:hypothetical protein